MGPSTGVQTSLASCVFGVRLPTAPPIKEQRCYPPAPPFYGEKVMGSNYKPFKKIGHMYYRGRQDMKQYRTRERSATQIVDDVYLSNINRLLELTDKDSEVYDDSDCNC